jgi:hypothetical protein
MCAAPLPASLFIVHIKVLISYFTKWLSVEKKTITLSHFQIIWELKFNLMLDD